MPIKIIGDELRYNKLREYGKNIYDQQISKKLKFEDKLS